MFTTLKRILTPNRASDHRNSVVYENDFATWGEAMSALPASQANSDERIIGLYNTLTSRDRETPRRPDVHSREIIDELLTVRAKHREHLSVIDIAAGPERPGIVARPHFGQPLRWSIVDAPAIAHALQGRNLLSLSWSRTFPAERHALALFAESLQYLSEPYERLAAAARVAEWVLVHRVPVSHMGHDRITHKRIARDAQIFVCAVFDQATLENALATLGTVSLAWHYAGDASQRETPGLSSYLVRVR